MSELSYVIPNTVPAEHQAGYAAAAALALGARLRGSGVSWREIEDTAATTAWSLVEGMEGHPYQDFEGGHPESCIDVVIGAVATLNSASKGVRDRALLRRMRMIYEQFRLSPCRRGVSRDLN